MFKRLNENNNNQIFSQQIAKIAVSISSQLMETGTVSEADFNNFDETMTKALAELIATELNYYFKLSEIGCHLTAAYDNEQSHLEEPQTPRPVPEEEIDDDDDDADDDDSFSPLAEFKGPLHRTMSMPMSSAYPRIISSSLPSTTASMGHFNQLAANLLIASGRVREQISELAKCLGISIDALGAASFQNVNVSETDKDSCHLKLVHSIFTFIGGRSGEAPQNDETHCARRVRTIETLCEISKMTWALMNLCVMTNTFRFASESPLFKTAAIDPIESVFGNNGWHAVHTTTTPDVVVAAATTATANNNNYDDDTPSCW
jgi:hypothetical protein